MTREHNHNLSLFLFTIVSNVCAVTGSHRASAGRGGRAGEGHHLLDGQPQFEAVKRVTDADLPLDLGVGQGRHDGAALHVGSARRHVPGRHSQPQLWGNRERRGDRFSSSFLDFHAVFDMI